jgi:outer membrane protein OmpA-like peptidoglycan-associated protein
MRNRIAIVAVLALAACTDLTKYTAEGQALVTQFGPQLAALVKDSDTLAAQVKSLPAGFPGVADLAAKVAANQGKIAGLKALVEGLPAKLAAAVKGGKEADVTALLAGFKKDVTEGLAAAGTAAKGFSGDFAALQAKVAEAAKVAVFEKALPGGFKLKGNPAGIEQLLVSYIEDPNWPADKTTWFDFDRLLFKTGSADLDMEKSKEQLANVTEILKAYPKVKLKVGGYTDNTGAAAANKKLSNERAKSVVAALVKNGLDAKRLVPEGYGSEHPVCPANDTEECKAKNRRISVRATAK